MQLDVLQRVLEDRFEQLSGERAEGRGIFALEHDQLIDIADLVNELSKQVRYGKPDGRHWLVWVIFATEIGYTYAGAEFWQTFGDRMPAWKQYADNIQNRRQIRAWCMQFSRKYRGVRPSGSWARQFSIIAWPITHAILPKDLQYHFAKALYTHRYRLASNNDPASIGQLIHAHSALATSRFREFSEQEELVGRIALALLGIESEELPLSSGTIKRILKDLERTQAAKDLLRQARDVRRIRGVRSNTQEVRSPQPSQTATPRFNLTPDLLLSKVNSVWHVGLLIPSFAPLASESAEIRQFLRTTKVQLQGGTGTWQPAEILTRPSKLHTLHQWLNDGVVVKFKDSHPILQHLLDMEGILSKGPIWVCKIGADGLARQMRRHLVRPGFTYIILAQTGHSFPHSQLLKSIEVHCQGIVGVRLELPSHISAETRELITSLGLRLTANISVWPAGIPAISWDGEGRSIWLSTDAPCFGIDVDHEVDAIEVMLDSDNSLTIPRRGIKGTSWLQLPCLPPGQHTLSVVVKGGVNVDTSTESTYGKVLLEVRDPLGMEDTISQRGGLMVIPSPIDATLDDFEQDRVTLDLYGPRDREVRVKLQILGSEGIEEQIVKCDLPVTLTKLWTKLSSNAQELLSVSTNCRLIVDAEEIGSFVLSLERISQPVRWFPRRSRQSMSLRLIDEAGLGDQAICHMASLKAPDACQSLNYDDCLDGFEIQVPGGLYVVSGKGRLDASIVSLPSTQHWNHREDLEFKPRLSNFAVSVSNLEQDIQLLTLWSKARIIGSLGAIRQTLVLRSMREALTKLVCGAAWLRAEAKFENYQRTSDALADLGDNITANPLHRNFAAKLRMSHKQVIEQSPTEVVNWLLPISIAFSICNDRNLIEMALRFFTDPEGFAEKSNDIVNDGNQLIAAYELVRGVRYLQILLEGKSWDWS